MIHLTPITAALLAVALQASSGAPTSTTASTVERLARALAEWELAAATSGEDAAVAAALEALATEARAAAAAAPTDAAVAREAEAIEAARARFRAERGLERPAAQQPGQEPRDPRASDEEVIATSILNHLHAGPSGEHQEAMLRFGARAVPALVASARSMNAASALGAPAIALDTLAQIDAHKALEVCVELSAQPSFLVRRAIAAVLSRRMLYGRDDVWIARVGADHVPAAPEWGLLIERLLGEPVVAAKDLRNVLAACAMRGYMPQSVIDAILSLEQIDEWPQMGAVPPGTRPLYLTGLASPRAEVRRQCAAMVRGFPDATPLFALHSDEDSRVRRYVADALGERVVAQSTLPVGSVTHVTVPPVPGPEHQAALEHCLADTELAVNRSAAMSLQLATYNLKLSLMPPADLARLAVSVPSTEIRLNLLQILSYAAPELVAGVAEATLSDPVIRATEKTYLDSYEALLNGASSADHAHEIASAVFKALEAHATPQEWGLVLDRDPNGPPALLVHLPEDSRVQLVRSLARHSPNAAWRLRDLYRSVPHDTAPWRTLVIDAAASPLARVVAVGWSLEEVTPSPEHVTASIDAVRRLSQSQAPPRPDWRQFAGWLERVASDGAERGVPRLLLLGALFADRSVPDELLLGLRIHNSRVDEQEAELARAVLARYPRESWSDAELFRDVLRAAHTLDRKQRVELIEGALLVGSRLWWSQALDATGRSRDPELLGVLRRFAESLTDDDYTRGLASTAASFLSDDAAKLILELAARTSSAEVRAAILTSLQQVIDYQTALANWQQRNDATAVRVRAINDLVALIDDASVPEAQRAEALRGLGLLGAVEELPRLVRTLTAPSAALQAAAREALDRLNAAPVK